MDTLSEGNLPKESTLAGYTIRQQIRTTLAGNVLKLEISNMNGDADLTVDAMYVAKLIDPSSSKINTSTNVQVTYKGNTSFTVSKGQTVETDEILISFDALEDLAVSMELGDTVPTVVTGHNGANCSSWLASGDFAAAQELTDPEIFESWYFIRMAVTATAENNKVIVAFGDSLTDGTGATANTYSRWPDELARQLQASTELNRYGVVNMGIAGSFVQWNMGRVDRDIINVPGVEAVVIYYGINDIANTDWDKSETMIGFYKEIIAKCHNAGVKVYMATLTPTGGAYGGYDGEILRQIKSGINEWIKSDECIADGYIDFENAVADPEAPERMQESMVCGWYDWLHFNDYGYKTLGITAYNALKEALAS